MSFSFVILDLENKLDVSQLQNFFSKNYAEYEIILCSSQNINKVPNVYNYVFDVTENKEKILNTVIKKCSKKNIVVIRDFLSLEEIKKQTRSLLFTNQIVYFEKDVSKVQRFFWNILQKLIKLLFFKDLLLINANCITYGEIASNVLKKIDSPSNLMRINNWQGIQLVSIDGGKKIKFKYNILKNVLLTFIPLIFTIILISLYFVFKTNISNLFGIIIWLSSIICLVLSVVFGLNWFIKSQIGENILENAKIKGDNK